MKDYYGILGVAKDADQKTIRDAFRKLALKHHPDRDKSPGAEERFKEIAEAYSVLSDRKKRAEYDSKGSVPLDDMFGGIDFGDLFGGFGRFFHHMGGDLEVELAVPLERIARGGEENVRLVRHEICPDCRGRGKIDGKFCRTCGGSGRVGREEILTVSIPPGMEEGAALRMKGKGLTNSQPPGDLYVVVRTLPDPRFERIGSDLWHAEPISVTDAVLGAELTVDTLEGRARVTVPPGAQPESVLRLKGKGLPKFGSSGKGDLYLKLKVRLPGRLSREERMLYEKLRGMAHGSA